MKMTNVEMLRRLTMMVIRKQTEAQAIQERPSFKRMNISAMCKVSSNEKSMKSALEPYIECEKELFKKYGITYKENGQPDLSLIENTPKKTEYEKELKELQSVELDVNIAIIKISEFGDYEISQIDYEAMEFMIE